MIKPKILTKQHWSGRLHVVEFGDDPGRVFCTWEEAFAYATFCIRMRGGDLDLRNL